MYPIVITCASIREARSCYDPTRYLVEEYKETLQTLLACTWLVNYLNGDTLA